MKIEIIPYSEFQRVMSHDHDFYSELALIADMCRFNALAMVKNAGSGHLGSSLSSMDIVAWLYYKELNILEEGLDSIKRDIYFSSKGHDVPGLYSVLFSMGILSEDQIVMLRRLGGLDGHPDVRTKGIEANSGSLGMGISKGKGMAWAKRAMGLTGDVYVMTGDGEFQEGQNYEALQACVQRNINNITVIMDHNKVQSDRPVEHIVSLGNLQEKLRTYGWHVCRIDGHDFEAIDQCFIKLKQITDRPKFIIADTIKGKGISFMEHPAALTAGKGFYPWHAGAPDDESFLLACSELKNRINEYLGSMGFSSLIVHDIEEIKQRSLEKNHLNALGEPMSAASPSHHSLKQNAEYVVEAFGKALVAIGDKRDDLVVLDADLSSDCRLRYFENRFPDRFIEHGIAEQDMVSTAGGLAKMGLLPVVNSFASFLASRANEQIYNNCTEQYKAIYALHYAGLIPAGPGKSHQSIRDISLLNAIPNIEIIQPCNAVETGMVVEYCVSKATENCAIRMNIGPSPSTIILPDSYTLTFGKGVTLRTGTDALLFAYGPIMLNEAINAAELLEIAGFHLQVVNMPWLNRIDLEWFRKLIENFSRIYILEDHATVGGLGDFLLHQMGSHNMLNERKVRIIGIDGYPACGSPSEVLNFHGLSAESLVINILNN